MAEKRKDKKGRVLRKGESQRKDLTYMYRWENLEGERKCIYAKTLDELRKKEDEIAKEIAVGVSRNSFTLNKQIEVYLNTKTKLANSTKENYQYYYNHSIKDSKIGKMKIGDIRKSDILQFYKVLSDKGYSAGTIKILHKIIHPALQLAYEDGTIVRNPSEGCTKEYSENSEKKYALTFSEEKELLERIQSRPRMKRYYPLYAFMLATGLRVSEVVGLSWNDINWETEEIVVSHQVQYRKYNGKIQFYANSTKTNAGNRRIQMTAEIKKILLEQKKIWFMTEKDNDFSVDGIKNFVFISHVTGRCMRHTSIRRMLNSVVAMNEKKELQLPDVTPHILRHTAATRWAEAGCDIKVLQYIMGHADIRTTMEIYNHIDSERVRREMDKLSELRKVVN